jgi:dihydroorotate dehydrogenase
VYRLARQVFFRFDPEVIHHWVMGWLSFMARHPGTLRLLSWTCELRDPRLELTRFGLKFPNPIGLAAGFDKDAEAVASWPALGFGAVELGTVTAQPQAGNPPPRLFRLVADEAIINRMGFNNRGALNTAERLGELRRGPPLRIPIGVNVGKSRNVPLEQAAEDYRQALALLWPHADYFALNVSSPNTPGLRELQAGERLDELLAAVMEFAAPQVPRPMLLKIAPDLSDSELETIAALAVKHRLAGLIAVNTTTSRDGLTVATTEAGGLSGRPLAARALSVLRFLAGLKTPLALISAGGIFSAEDVYTRLKAGACLVQLYTSFIYQGPRLLYHLNRGLLKQLEGDGLSSLEAVIGQDLR